jgi:hypothetical protein
LLHSLSLPLPLTYSLTLALVLYYSGFASSLALVPAWLILAFMNWVALVGLPFIFGNKSGKVHPFPQELIHFDARLIEDDGRWYARR